MHSHSLAGGEFDAVAIFVKILRLALAGSAHFADCVLEEIALTAAVAAIGGWVKEGCHVLCLSSLQANRVLGCRLASRGVSTFVGLRAG